MLGFHETFCLRLGDRLLSPYEWSGKTAITVPAKGVGGLVQCSLQCDTNLQRGKT